jgi:beta-glucosidase
MFRRACRSGSVNAPGEFRFWGYLRRIAGVGLALVAVASVSAGVTAAAPGDGGQSTGLPYSLPAALPAPTSSPAVEPRAPYTPVVLSLIHQLEPSNPPTRAEVANAAKLLHGDGFKGAGGFGIPDGPDVPSCNSIGPVAAPSGTTPSISPLCWSDAQGLLPIAGPNTRGTTAPMTLMGLGSSFDRRLGNGWGQTEGTEARKLMVTGLFGPQTDLDRLPNWGRNLTTTGEDPFLSHELVAAQINGIQGVGTMSQMKHFAVYNGQNQNLNTDIQDQALHELYLTPYEGGIVDGKAAATMCSYQIFRDTSAHLPASVSSLTQSSPFGSTAPPTWPLGESHFSCEQPLLLNYVLRDLWNSKALVGSDYPATHSTSGILQGEDQELPPMTSYFTDTPIGGSSGFGATTPLDPTGSTCADAAGNAEPCSTPGAVHVAGIPGPGCKDAGGNPGPGCTLVDAVMNGTVPLAVFNQSLARVLYQEERFGLLGCDDTPRSALCTNPGGVGSDRTGNAQLPTGATQGKPVLGTKNGDAAIAERESEEGAVLLKNEDHALPLTRSDLNGGVLVTGPGANHTIAGPTAEAAIGFVDRDAVNPLQQLKQLSGRPNAFTYVPANEPTGEPVPSSALSTSTSSVTGNLNRTGPGGTTTDSTIDYTTATGHGQLAPGSYTWTGYIYVPTTDTYTFRVAQSSTVPAANATFTFDGTPRTLASAADVYPSRGPVGPSAAVPGTPTTAGYTEPLLTNQQYTAGTLTGGTFHAIAITFNNTSGAPASFRFGYSRAAGDIADAAAAAAGEKLAIVFLNDAGATSQYPTGSPALPSIAGVNSLSQTNTDLINAVAAANPNTVVVLNTSNPVLMPWVGNVKGALQMWFSGQEGGTSTARLLLGLANPSGHTDITWPARSTDTIWGYNETAPLYPGDTLGQHPERLNGNGGCTGAGCPAATGTVESEGIFSGYRFFDQEHITPLFPFGYGLSYTTFRFSTLHLQSRAGEADVRFTVTNTGWMPGTEVAQVYIGPGPDIPGVQQAVRSLRGFQRITLDPGRSERITIHLDARSFQYWNEGTQRWTTNWGPRTIWAGDADGPANLPLTGELTLRQH